jgi:hypothetical protein
MTPDEVLEQNVSIPLIQWVEFKAERDALKLQVAELIEALTWCVNNNGECLGDHMQRLNTFRTLLAYHRHD